MFRLNKFLCCIKLELGGTLIGWLNLLASVICIYVTIFNLGDDLLYLVGSLLLSVIYGSASFFFIQGVKMRSHVTTQPFRVLCIVAFLALIFGIVYIIAKLKSKKDDTIFFHHLVEATLCFVVETYVLLVVESLHKRFRDEKFNHGGFIINRY